MSEKGRALALALVIAVGALNLALYPGVFLAGIMGLAATGPAPTAGQAPWRVFLVASFFYPLLWAGLWLCAWLAMRRGRFLLALTLATPPALVTVGGGGYMMLEGKRGRAAVGKMQSDHLSGLRADNPLVADISAFGSGLIDWPRLARAIQEADASLLSKPAGQVGTPLRLTLVISGLEQSLDMAKTRPHSLEAARLLLARGATLSDQEEAFDFGRVWMVGVLRRGLTLPDPAAASENPVVWSIVTAPANALPGVGAALRKDPALLNKSTRTYGTPLAAALLCVNIAELNVYSLASRGAELSAAERKTPSLVNALEKWFSRYPAELKDKYVAAHGKLGIR